MKSLTPTTVQSLSRQPNFPCLLFALILFLFSANDGEKKEKSNKIERRRVLYTLSSLWWVSGSFIREILLLPSFLSLSLSFSRKWKNTFCTYIYTGTKTFLDPFCDFETQPSQSTGSNSKSIKQFRKKMYRDENQTAGWSLNRSLLTKIIMDKSIYNRREFLVYKKSRYSWG